MRNDHNYCVFLAKAAALKYPKLQSDMDDLWRKYCNEYREYIWRHFMKYTRLPDPVGMFINRLQIILDHCKAGTWEPGSYQE